MFDPFPEELGAVVVVDPVWATDALGVPLEHAAPSKATAVSAATTRLALRGRSRRGGSSVAGVVGCHLFHLLVLLVTQVAVW